MSPSAPVQQDVISPAETKFWQEWADKMPALIPKQTEKNLANFDAEATPYKIAGVTMGAALSAATFTKLVPGKWKWASGAAALASFAGAYLMHSIRANAIPIYRAIESYAQALGQRPELRQQLANALSVNVTAEKIQAMGLERAVVNEAINVGMEMERLGAPNYWAASASRQTPSGMTRG